MNEAKMPEHSAIPELETAIASVMVAVKLDKPREEIRQQVEDTLCLVYLYAEAYARTAVSEALERAAEKIEAMEVKWLTTLAASAAIRALAKESKPMKYPEQTDPVGWSRGEYD